MTAVIAIGLDTVGVTVIEGFRSQLRRVAAEPAMFRPVRCLGLALTDPEVGGDAALGLWAGGELVRLWRTKVLAALDHVGAMGTGSAGDWLPVTDRELLRSEVQSFGGSRPVGRLAFQVHVETITTALRRTLRAPRESWQPAGARLAVVADAGEGFASGALVDFVQLCRQQDGVDSIVVYLLLPGQQVPSRARVEARRRLNAFACVKELAFLQAAPRSERAGRLPLTSPGLPPVRVFFVQGDGSKGSASVEALLMAQAFRPLAAAAMSEARELEEPLYVEWADRWAPVRLHTAGASVTWLNEVLPPADVLARACRRAVADAAASAGAAASFDGVAEEPAVAPTPTPTSAGNAGGSRGAAGNGATVAVADVWPQSGLTQLVDNHLKELDEAVGRAEERHLFWWLGIRGAEVDEATGLEALWQLLTEPPQRSSTPTADTRRSSPAMGDGEAGVGVPPRRARTAELRLAIVRNDHIRRLLGEAGPACVARCDVLGRERRSESLLRLRADLDARPPVAPIPPLPDALAEACRLLADLEPAYDRRPLLRLGLPTQFGYENQLRLNRCAIWRRALGHHRDWLRQAMTGLCGRELAAGLAAHLAEESRRLAAQSPSGSDAAGHFEPVTNAAAGASAATDHDEAHVDAAMPFDDLARAALAQADELRLLLQPGTPAAERHRISDLLAQRVRREALQRWLATGGQPDGSPGSERTLDSMIDAHRHSIFRAAPAEPSQRSFGLLMVPGELADDSLKGSGERWSGTAVGSRDGVSKILRGPDGVAWFYYESLFHPPEDLVFLEQAQRELAHEPLPNAYFVDRPWCDSPAFQAFWERLGAADMRCGNPGCQASIADLPRDERLCPACGGFIRTRCGNPGCRKDFENAADATQRYCPHCHQFNHAAFWICHEHGKFEVYNAADSPRCQKCVVEHQADPLKRPRAAIALRPDLTTQEICWNCQDKAAEDAHYKPFFIPRRLMPFVRDGVGGGDRDAFLKIAQDLGLKDSSRCPHCHQLLIPIDNRAPAKPKEPPPAVS